jgi:hypothetical protein
MDGHVLAFPFFGRVTLSVLHDSEADQATIHGIVSSTNRCLVSKILQDFASGPRRSAPCSHYLFADRYGRPGKGNE